MPLVKGSLNIRDYKDNFMAWQDISKTMLSKNAEVKIKCKSVKLNFNFGMQIKQNHQFVNDS